MQGHLFLLLYRFRQLQGCFAGTFVWGAATGFADVILIGVEEAMGVRADTVGSCFVGVSWHSGDRGLKFTEGDDDKGGCGDVDWNSDEGDDDEKSFGIATV